MGAIKGRAETPQEKRQVVERILRAWERVPALRLGQLLSNVAAATRGADLFSVEDTVLAEWCSAYVTSVEAEPRTHSTKKGA